MDFIKFSINNPVTVIVGVIFIVMFGLVSFGKLPYQLSPHVQRPIITVMTIWPGATPYEIERDIVEEQEKALKGLPALDQMESSSSNGMGQVTLRFDIGTDVYEALLRVSNKLDEVPSYPENVEKPVINATGAESSPVIYMVLRPLPGNTRNIYTYRSFFLDECQQFFERVEGVAEATLYGGIEKEMHVVVEPERLAAYGLTIAEVIAALRGDNINISAGNLGVGRREYRIRAISEFRSPEDIEKVVVISDGQRRVRIGDLANVEFGYEKLTSPSLQEGTPGITIAIRPETDANVLRLTDDVERVVQELNESRLKKEGLQIEWLYDLRPYIQGAIGLLRRNILIGGSLAICVLLLFLRSFASTVIVATAIPISVVGSFIFMNALGTSLNVVSLAGIAFAVGMLVDNAIVVLENIDRHRGMGKQPLEAAYDGAREVWGAVLASSLTTVAVFLPVLFLEQEAGLLFRDIAIAVTFAVLISLIVSVSVIPMVSRKLFESRLVHRFETKASQKRSPLRVGATLSRAFMAVVGLVLHNAFTRIFAIAALTLGAVFTATVLFPKMEYLPQGNRDLIFNMLIPPPGLSYQERLEIGEHVYNYLKPYYEPREGYPAIRRIFYSGRETALMVGVISSDQQRTRELIPLCQKMMATIPGVFGVSNQAGIFDSGMGRGRTIDVDFFGPDIYQLVETAGQAMDAIRQEIPGVQIRPVPSLDILYPEAQFTPDGESLRAVGMTAWQFGVALDVLMDGRDIGEFKAEGEKKIDLVVKVADTHIEGPEDLYNALIPTPAGKTVPISSLATMQKTTGITAIRHLERNRTFSLQVTPPYSVTLQETMEIIDQKIAPQLEAQGAFENVNMAMSGTADRLVQAREALQWNFLLAAAITYLLMSALFGNFIYPLVIMFTVPLAGAGGFIGLKLVNLFVAPQQLDILTMLGFIILIGVVVNNAILIVHQSLNNVRIAGMPHREAVLEATRSRLRPIYMTAATSIFGMLPLVIWPGPGSELYRGLGSVVLGGLALSTLFTVFLIPSLLLFFIRMEGHPEKKLAPEEALAK